MKGDDKKPRKIVPFPPSPLSEPFRSAHVKAQRWQVTTRKCGWAWRLQEEVDDDDDKVAADDANVEDEEENAPTAVISTTITEDKPLPYNASQNPVVIDLITPPNEVEVEVVTEADQKTEKPRDESDRK